MANHHPISNLSFLSKTVERVTANQLKARLIKFDLLPKAQSAYCPHHSTENTLLRILSDVHDTADKGKVTRLALLDLSAAAFNCMGHVILLQRLELKIRLQNWIKSHFTDWSLRVLYYDTFSCKRKIHSGIPQGSINRPTALCDIYLWTQECCCRAPTKCPFLCGRHTTLSQSWSSRFTYGRTYSHWLRCQCRKLLTLQRPFEMRSDAMRILLTLRTHNRMGDHSFRAIGPTSWNSLTSSLWVIIMGYHNLMHHFPYTVEDTFIWTISCSAFVNAKCAL